MKGKVLFILNPKHGPATARIRGTIYEDVLRDDGWEVAYASLSSVASNPELDRYRMPEEEILRLAAQQDVIYLLKINDYFLVKKLRARTNAKLVFDLTDALWRPVFRKSWLFLEEIMMCCDAVTTENVYATAYASAYNSNVIRLEACTQTEKFDEARATAKRRDDSTIVVGWIGSGSTIQAIDSILPQLERVLAKFPHVELRLLVSGKTVLNKRLQHLRHSVLFDYTEEDMIREALTMDIGLFPPPADVRDYEIRGALKAMIYMSAGIPAVCLHAGDSINLIEDGVTGMLVKSPDEWETCLATLIQDPEKRRSMGDKALAQIRNDHSLESVGQALSQALLSARSHTNQLAGGFSFVRKLRILLRSFVNQ